MMWWREGILKVYKVCASYKLHSAKTRGFEKLNQLKFCNLFQDRREANYIAC